MSKIYRLLLSDHLVLLASSEADVQHALNRFAAACENENQHFQNYGTTSFKKSCPMFSASGRRIIEAGREVQVFWDRIHERLPK